MVRTEKFAWFPTKVISWESFGGKLFETIWLKHYYNYSEWQNVINFDQDSTYGVEYIDKLIHICNKLH